MRTTTRNGIAAVMTLSVSLLSGGSVARSESIATYELLFTKLWWPDSHPTDYPSTAHFSGLAGSTHSSDVSFWNLGELATRGIQDIAERGNKAVFSTEVNSALTSGTADRYLSYFGISGDRVSRTETFQIRESFPLATIVSMLAPSPDWFVGISSFDMRAEGEWVSSAHFDLFPWDAGTDDGITFFSDNLPASPHQPIQLLDTFPFEGTGPVATFDLRLLAVSEFVAVAGDYNRDGTAGADDYTVWRNTLGSTTNLAADGNGNNQIDTGDYGVWQQNFGQTSGSGSSTIAKTAVPEPATIMMLLIVAAAGCCLREGGHAYKVPKTH